MNEAVMLIFSPCGLLFTVSFVGILLGRIRIGSIRIGIAGVLITSVLFGYILQFASGETYSLLQAQLIEGCSTMSTLGIALFVSVIGITAGQNLTPGDAGRQAKAFLAGMIIVSIGGAITVILSLLFNDVPKEMMLGAFSGGMTNSPTLALINELISNSYLATIAYGTTYLFGVLFVMIFVYLPVKNQEKEAVDKIYSQGEKKCVKEEFLHIIVFVSFIGIFLGRVFPVGTSGGCLLCGGIVGFILIKRGIYLSAMNDLRQLGLMMFFVGNGVPAGMKLINGVDWRIVLVGIIVPIVSIFGGGWIINRSLNISGMDLHAVVCGGMTSSPAFGVLQKRDSSVDSALYAISYAGALIALFLWTYLLVCII